MLKNISDRLQNHPIAITLMFLVSMLGSVITVILGWEQFYNDYLSKTISIPVWLFILLAIVVFVVVISLQNGKSKTAKKDLEKIEGATFGVQQIKVDGKSFRRCEFKGTELIFEGDGVFEFVSNGFEASRFTFAGKAGNTVIMLTKMYSDPGFRPFVESTLNNIKQGKIPESVPVKNIA